MTKAKNNCFATLSKLKWNNYLDSPFLSHLNTHTRVSISSCLWFINILAISMLIIVNDNSCPDFLTKFFFCESFLTKLSSWKIEDPNQNRCLVWFEICLIIYVIESDSQQAFIFIILFIKNICFWFYEMWTRFDNGKLPGYRSVYIFLNHKFVEWSNHKLENPQQPKHVDCRLNTRTSFYKKNKNFNNMVSNTFITLFLLFPNSYVAFNFHGNVLPLSTSRKYLILFYYMLTIYIHTYLYIY